MSEPVAASNGKGIVAVVSLTVAALRQAANRWDSRGVFLGASFAYLLLYLVTIGDVSLAGSTSGSFAVRIIDDLSRGFTSVGFFRFDAIAVIAASGVTFLLSPLNLLVAGTLAVLVGANLSLTYLGLIQPKACGLEASTGVVAGIPALLSGAACCGPTFLLLVGVQASATLVSGFQVLVPLAIIMLVGSLLLIGRQVNPALL